MDDDAGFVPRCPITGAPAKRRVQWLYAATLAGLWRYAFGVDITDLVAGVERFGLWESPVGLLFFAPPIAGDGAFYRHLYTRIRGHERLAGPNVARPEFKVAASLVRPGARLLDVGCGEGGLQRRVPTVNYVGLDPIFGGKRDGVLAETIEGHAARNAGHYDLVCSFHVIEHVPDPLAFVGAMVTAIKTGGLLLLAVPCWPSAITAIPNFVLNAPPHHLSWWSESALRALCLRLDLRCRSVEPVPVGRHNQILYWMARVAPKLGEPRFFKTDWWWHLGLLWSYLAGRCANAVLSSAAGRACDGSSGHCRKALSRLIRHCWRALPARSAAVAGPGVR